MKSVQIICFLVLVSLPAWAGDSKVDSLKQLLEQHTTTDKAEVLWGIAYELFDVDNAQALFYAERAYHDVWRRGDSLQIVKVGTTYGQLLRRMGKLDHSIEISSRMLPIAKRHEYRKYWKMLLNSLGYSYIDKSIYDLALDLNYQSLVLRKEDGDTMEVVSALVNIGLIHYRIGDWERALDYGSQCIELIRSLKSIKKYHEWSRECLALAFGNIACVYHDQGRYQDAIKYFRLALIDINDPSSYEWTFARSFHEIGKLDSAKHYALKAIKGSKAKRNFYALACSYVVMSRLKSSDQDWVHSQDYLDSAIQIGGGMSYPFLNFYISKQQLRLLALKSGENKMVQALERYEKYADSLNSLNGQSRIKSVQIAFAQRENEAKLKAQSAIMMLQRENLDRQQTFILVVLGLLIVLIFLALALFRANKHKQEINQMLDRIVEARTKELAKHRDALQHLIDEENGRRSRATAELMGMFSSLRGLLHLAKVDPDKREDDYLEKALGLTVLMESVSQKYNEQTQRKPQIPGT